MNHLQHETSPYLLQHANNPVEWHAWKPEALEKARKEDKPILVSIGYSTCHWCHVMERESFEDEEVAEFMNEHFLCIKVDREERPDVDQIYMEACQILTGSGGWPLNCFLTPDGRPFYAGTYFPPMPAYNRPSWLQVLMQISHAFQNKRKVVEDQANRLTEMIEKSSDTFTGNKLTVVGKGSPFSSELLQRIYTNLQKHFDRIHGGFGAAPKFPGTMSLHYLLNYHYYTGETEALEQLRLSLDKMIMGGIYDQIGGGFARYSTDVKWLVPHFEKMLYDNALLVCLLSDAYKMTKNDLYRETIEETLEWVSREMTNDEGAFYSALDADSEGVEGKFYVWEKSEVENLLGRDAPLFCEFYGVTDHGNWEEKNILWRQWKFWEFADAKNLDVEELKLKLSVARKKLFNARSKRVHPGLDDKTLLGWNALMCTAYAKAYSALGNELYKESALKNLHFLLEKMAKPGGTTLFHTFKGGKPQYDAFLDDYAFLIEALLEVYEITYDTRHLQQAVRYTEFVLDNFLDEQEKMFYFTSAQQKDIILRRKDLYDSATPSGNSTMVRNLQRLSILFDNIEYHRIVENMLISMKDSVERYPSSFGRWATTMMNEVYGIPEIAVLGDDALNVAQVINTEFLPQRVLMASTNPDEAFPLLAGKNAGNDTLIYLCENFTCQKPVKTIEEFRQLAGAVKSLCKSAAHIRGIG
jgi:hypothetical protein